MWLACCTQGEIAEAVGMDRVSVTEVLKELSDLDTCPNPTKLAARYQEADWSPPLYNVWSFGKKTNAVRKNLTPTEAVAIAAAVEPLEREAARERREATQLAGRNACGEPIVG